MLSIALFGTSADPPTIAHQAIIEWLGQQFDQVVVWAADNPFKDHFTPLQHRQEMLRLLIEPIHTRWENISLHPELSHPKTLRTVKQAQQLWPKAEFTLVVGADVIAKMPHWYQVQALLSQVKLLIISRPGVTLIDADLQQLRHQGADLRVAEFEGPNISSTDYREAGNKAGLTPVVREYIQREGLYPCTAETSSNIAQNSRIDLAPQQ